jgi:hypothetical protein
LRRQGLKPLAQFAVLMVMAFAAPLPALAFVGMEHTLHAFLAMCLLATALPLLRSDRPLPATAVLLPTVLATLTTMARFEGLFMVFTLAILCIAKRRVWQAGLLMAAAILPVVVYGMLSVHAGSMFLPNSVLVKGLVERPPGLTGFAKHAIEGLMTPHLYVLILAAMLCAYLSATGAWKISQQARSACYWFVGMALLHIAFASIGWFYRYEAYLVALGVVTVGMCLPAAHRGVGRRGTFQTLAILLILAAPLLVRSVEPRVSKACRNIYEQQYQMGLFLHDYYTGRTVVANDVGAVNYLADVRCLDLVGLASVEVARLRVERKWDAQRLQQLVESKDAAVAVVYDSWIDDIPGMTPVPGNWRKAGQWKIADNVICGNDTVSFYALSSAEFEPLVAHLAAFSPRLPASVTQSGAYTKRLRSP